MAVGQTQPLLMPGGRSVQVAEPSALANLLGANALFREGLSALGTLLLPVDEQVTSIQRILVLIPGGRIDPEPLVARVQRLVGCTDLEVLYVGIRLSPDQDWRASRQLAGLLIASVKAGLRVQTRLVANGEWLPILRGIVQPGDLILCHAEQSARQSKDPYGTLGWWVASSLNVPVYVLSGMYMQALPYALSSALRLAFRIAPILIVGGFFWIQIQIDKLVTGLAHTLVLSLSVLIEFGLVFFWSYLLDRLSHD